MKILPVTLNRAEVCVVRAALVQQENGIAHRTFDGEGAEAGAACVVVLEINRRLQELLRNYLYKTDRQISDDYCGEEDSGDIPF